MDQGQSEAGRNQLDAFETNLIRVKAAVLVQRGLVPRSEIDDVRQELAMAVLVTHGKVRLDPKTRRGLASRVVDHAASNLVRDRRCPKRDPFRTCSLEAILTDGENPVEATTDDTEASRERVVDLQLDVAELLATLPDDLRQLAELLKKRSVTEAAAQLGVARTSLYTNLRALRERFRRAGLEKYLPKSVVTSDANGVVPR